MIDETVETDRNNKDVVGTRCSVAWCDFMPLHGRFTTKNDVNNSHTRLCSLVKGTACGHFYF